MNYSNVKVTCAEIQKSSTFMSTCASLSVLPVYHWNALLLSGCRLGSIQMFGHASRNNLYDTLVPEYNLSRRMSTCLAVVLPLSDYPQNCCSHWHTTAPCGCWALLPLCQPLRLELLATAVYAADSAYVNQESLHT